MILLSPNMSTKLLSLASDQYHNDLLADPVLGSLVVVICRKLLISLRIIAMYLISLFSAPLMVLKCY